MTSQIVASPQITLLFDEVRTGSPFPDNYDYLTLWRIIFKCRESSSKPGCWEWTGATCGHKLKYGTLSYRGQVYKVTRLIKHLISSFDLNSDLLILHHCDNPLCVNPEHLYAGTARDNVRDCRERNRISRGEKHSPAKLSDKQVNQLRLDYAGGMSSYALSRKYKVHNAYAWRLATKKRRHP